MANTEYFKHAEIALAAYANLGIGEIDEQLLASVKFVGLQAQDFSNTYEVVDFFTDSNGLSATVFGRKDGTGEKCLAIRGTNDLDDLWEKNRGRRRTGDRPRFQRLSNKGNFKSWSVPYFSIFSFLFFLYFSFLGNKRRSRLLKNRKTYSQPAVSQKRTIFLPSNGINTPGTLLNVPTDAEAKLKNGIAA